MKTLYRTSTAMTLALSLAAPAPLHAQSTLQVLQEGTANPENRPVCSDGTMPTCPGGASVLTFGEMTEIDSGGGELAASLRAIIEGNPESGVAVCSDGTEASCPEGAAVLVPGAEGYAAAVDGARMDGADEPVEAAEPMESAAPADPEAMPTESGEVIAETGEGEPLQMEGTVETDGAAEAAAGAAAEAEAETEAELQAEAEAEEPAEASPDAAEAAQEPAVAAETDPDALAEALAEEESAAGAEAAAEAEGEVEADAEVEGEAAAEAEPPVEAAPAPEAGETDAGALAEALAEEQGEDAPQTQADAAEAPADADAAAAAEAEAEAEAEPVEETAEAPTEEAPTEPEPEATAEAPGDAQAETDGELVAEGNEDLAERAEQAAQAIGAATEGEGSATDEVAAAAAAAEGEAEAEVTETTETTLTEEDTRQSTEDFTTTASGQASATAEADDDEGLSTFERAALAGLGALAVGALLNSGDRVVANTGDRVVVQRGENDYYVLKDDDSLLRQPGANVRTETFADGSTRTTVTRDNGSKIITIRDAAGRVLRRVSEAPDGTRTVLIDDTASYETVQVETLPDPEPRVVTIEETDPQAIRAALERASAANVGRAFSLRQIRQIEQVRKLVPEIALDNINFETASAAIRPGEAEELARLGDLLKALIEDNPGEVFLIEGHTDAVGSAAYNLALSDRRAESVALALTEYFDVPPENMVVQGYGESDLKVQTQEAERENRRVSVRRITPLLIDRVAEN